MNGSRPRPRGARVALALALLLPSAAQANGRYPSAQQLIVAPGDPSRLWLRATYGFLTSADSGRTWSWVCEAAIGYGTLEDPPLLVTSSGAVLVATSLGLRISTDHGCRWPLHPDVGDLFSVDLTASPDGTRAFALTSFVQPDTGQFDLVVWKSEDAGARFVPVGPPVASDIAGQTLDVAPSDPARLYVTGLVVRTAPLADGGIPPAASPEGVLLRSRDGGDSWERLSIPGTSNSDWPLIAAVHPERADELFVRVRGRPKARGELIESWLLHSRDAGDTWTEVFRAKADMLGFALGPGGAPIYLGLGDSYDVGRQREVDPDVVGLYRADSPAGPFALTLPGQIGGLTRAAAGLYLLGSGPSLGFEVGLSTDGGDTAAPVLSFGPAILGPPSCGFGDAEANRCLPEWPTACTALSACAPPDAGPGRDSGAPPDAGEAPRDPSGSPSGCGCRSAGTVKGSPVAPTVLVGLLAALARRTRRTRQRQPCT